MNVMSGLGVGMCKNTSKDDFFELDGDCDKLHAQEDFFKLTSNNAQGLLENKLYWPDTMTSPDAPRRWVIRGKIFKNFSFSKTIIMYVEFIDCNFEKCLFIGSIIEKCRFNNCSFYSCNFYRSQFNDTFVDTRSFDKCIPDKRYANIAVGLYQELLHNSRQQDLAAFSMAAQWNFHRWQRRRIYQDDWVNGSDVWKKSIVIPQVFKSWLLDITSGYGMGLINFSFTACLFLLCLTLLNYLFRFQLGLDFGEGITNGLVDSFYFTSVVGTSLGFGDVVPKTDIGRIVVSLEAIAGFVVLATLVSMIFRRISG